MFKINSSVSVIFHLTGYRQTINSNSKTLRTKSLMKRKPLGRSTKMTLLDLSQTFAKQKIKATTYSNSNPKRLELAYSNNAELNVPLHFYLQISFAFANVNHLKLTVLT